jgi:hypothetical protein
MVHPRRESEQAFERRGRAAPSVLPEFELVQVSSIVSIRIYNDKNCNGPTIDGSLIAHRATQRGAGSAAQENSVKK